VKPQPFLPDEISRRWHAAYYTVLAEAHKAVIESISPGPGRAASYEAGNAIFPRDGSGEGRTAAGEGVNKREGRLSEGNLRPYNRAPLRHGVVAMVESLPMWRASAPPGTTI
jgi:hypothetical protein